MAFPATTTSPLPGAPDRSARVGITPRALILGLAISAAVCAIVAWAEYVTGAIMIGFLQIPPVAVALLFVIILLNRLTGYLWPAARLRPAELAVIYVMMVFSAMIASRGLTEDVYPTLAGLNYLATPANHWESLYFSHIKPSLVPWDPARGAVQPVVRYYYEGLPLGAAVPWGAWLLPTALWLILYGLVYMCFMGLAAVVYKLWADEEHLSFPLVSLPLEMIGEQSGGFLRNPLLWIGFALPVLYFGLKGLRGIWPTFPLLRVQQSLRFNQAPWSSMGYTEMWFSMAGVGFFYLLSSEMVFSLWFFFILARLQEVVAGSFGIPAGGSHASAMAFVADQTAGVSFALVALMVYTSWVRVRDIWRRQAERDPTAVNTLVRFRTAAWLVGLALVGIVIWWKLAGGSVAVALVEFGVYMFVQAVIMARGTSEAGIPMAEGSFTPFDILGFFARKSSVGRSNLTLLAFSNAMFTRDLRGVTLTGMLDAQRLADGVRLARRKLAPVIVTVLIFAVLVSGFLHLSLTYQRGGITMYGYLFRGNNQQFWHEHAPPMEGLDEWRAARPLWFGVGILLCIFLSLMRRLYVWWPLHPLGAALSVTWVMCVFWFPALVSWLVKSAITRYGGVRTYLKLRPFFLGLIFGEFFMAVVWSILSFALHINAPMFPWP